MAEQTCIGLLPPLFQPITAYERAAASLGVELAVVTPARIDWQAEQVEALVWSGADWQTKTVDLPRAFYNRYGPKPKVVNRLELLGGKRQRSSTTSPILTNWMSIGPCSNPNSSAIFHG